MKAVRNPDQFSPNFPEWSPRDGGYAIDGDSACTRYAFATAKWSRVDALIRGEYSCAVLADTDIFRNESGMNRKGFTPLSWGRPSRLRVEPAENSIANFFAPVTRIVLRNHYSLRSPNGSKTLAEIAHSYDA
jgi:hypothetical protein